MSKAGNQEKHKLDLLVLTLLVFIPFFAKAQADLRTDNYVPINNYWEDSLKSNQLKIHALPFLMKWQDVKDHPYNWNDGAMIPAKGLQRLTRFGVHTQWKFIELQLAPEFVLAENLDFDQFSLNLAQVHWKDYYRFYNFIELPERMGDKQYVQNFPGQSFLKFHYKKLALGISTENKWWGPSQRNSLLLSNTGAGFPHITLASQKPLDSKIGTFNFELITGALTNGKYTPPEPYKTFNGNLMYVPKQNELRIINGFTLSYQPKWIKGFSVGVTRVVQEPASLFEQNKQWNLLFNNVARVNDASFLVEIQRDQYAAAFLRWVWQPAHAEFYTEWGRNDTYYTMRDFIQQPEHSRAYTYGFRKLFGSALETFNTNSFLKTPKHYWQFISEYTRTQQPSTWPVRTAGSWYVRGDMPGYTQMGQIMGAPIGSGGNYQMMRISKFNGWKQIGLQIESTTHNAENFEGSGLAFTNPSKSKWVDYGFRILYDYPYKHFLFSTTLAATRSFNYNWSQPANASGLGLGNPNDLDSYLLKFAIRFL